MTTAPFAVIILAAGYSSRMGRFKPVIKLGGMTITARLIDLYQAHKIDSYLVVGWQQEELRRALEIAPFQFVENPDFDRGMFTSIQAGVKAIQGHQYQAFFIQPVDVPLVRSFTLKRVLGAGLIDPRKIVYPCFAGQRGHPPLIPLSLSSAIMDWPGAGGLRGFLQTREDLVREIKVADSNILFDIDTPDTLGELERRFQALTVPSREECAFIMEDICAVPEPVRRHCAAVAKLAGEIGRALMERGVDLNQDLIRAGAALHDLCKGQPQHESEAAALLRQMGFDRTAEVVANHTDLGDNPNHNLETKVVFLADKLVREDRRIDLAERYEAARQKFGQSSEALLKINQRQAEANGVKQELEARLGYKLETLVFKNQ